MKATRCLEAFVEGTVFSKTSTRTQGAYKLAERLDQWKDSEQEVSRIAAALKHPSLRHDLKSCTFQDKHVWIRRTLKITAYELSESIICSNRDLI